MIRGLQLSRSRPLNTLSLEKLWTSILSKYDQGEKVKTILKINEHPVTDKTLKTIITQKVLGFFLTKKTIKTSINKNLKSKFLALKT